MQVSRRQFFKICGAGMSGSSIALMGFSPTSALAEVRSYKLAHATETRNMCPYCSVSCGVLIYTTGDKSKNAKADIIHIEGDPDNPVNRGTLCPKGAGLLDMVKSPNRLKFPEVREPGTNESEAHQLGRRADTHRQAHEGRPRRQLHREERRRRDGEPLEHLRLPRFIRRQQRNGIYQPQGTAQPRRRRLRYASTHLTRPHGIQSGSDIRAWCNDQSLGRH